MPSKLSCGAPINAGHGRSYRAVPVPPIAGCGKFSGSLLAALTAELLVGTVLGLVGLPGLAPLPGGQTIAIFDYAMVACLVANDAVKVAMMKWWVPMAT
jgi:hypothetical protein